MNTPVADVTGLQAADRHQAAYFRRVLQERCAELGERIASHERLLIMTRNGNASDDARRTRRVLREDQRERVMVQRLIERLDARFPVDGTGYAASTCGRPRPAGS